MNAYRYKNVLLIDDNHIDNLINRKILDNANFAEIITVIDSPQEAFDFVRDSITTGKNIPEVIFLDLRMPVMSGFEFLKSIIELPNLKPDLFKIYVLSSSLDPKDLKRIKENHLVSKFIGKPLTNQILEEI
ncbi:response regulator [Daejeonella sp.]|uniref:response regulator n=1 Tax=Daejeonella sp. TaxID=2805397 RepID=UPI00398345F6